MFLGYPQPGPVRRSNCTSSPCKICHGDLAYRMTPKGSPRFARATESATRRAIASSSCRPGENKSEAARQKSKEKNEKSSRKWTVKDSRFLNLPIELRYQIYANCLTYDDHLKSPRVISGWVEGGGRWHPDYTCRYPRTYLYAQKKFPVQLLLICKTITREAREEIYRLNQFRIDAPSPAHIVQLRYWLGKHPIRFTSHLTIPFGINLGRNEDERTKLRKHNVIWLARTIKTMPRLVELNIPLLIHANAYSALRSLLKKGIQEIFASLIQLANIVTGKIQLRVDVVFQFSLHQFQRGGPFVPFSEDQKNVLRSFLKAQGINITESSETSYTNIWHL
jgi:hypothetical protein